MTTHQEPVSTHGQDPSSTENPGVRPWKAVFHLLALGLLLALMIALLKGPPQEQQNVARIVVTAADVAQVKARYERLWNRSPTQMELRGALEQYVRDEILYREALARGLDRGDPTVRLAMVRKIRMLGAIQADAGTEDDDEIKAYFALRQERYRVPAILSLAHIYLNPDKRGDNARADAERILIAIREREMSADELQALGDPTLLHPVYRDLTEKDIDIIFGADFYARISTLTSGEWGGPIESGYGLHLVKVIERTESRIPEWTEVRQQILNDMQFEARKAAEDQFFQEIAGGYQILYTAETAEVLTGETQ